MINMGGWQLHSVATRSRHTCAGCNRKSDQLEGWVWRAIPGYGRPTESLCDRCFNRVRQLLQKKPCCQRCGSDKLVRDTLVSGRGRITCEICAWFRLDPIDVASDPPARATMDEPIGRLA